MPSSSSSDVIIHEYHYPGGPLTYEYAVGGTIPEEHVNLLSPFVRQFSSQSADSIRERLAVKWEHVHPVIKPIATWLLSLDLCSLAFTDSTRYLNQSWIVFRGANDQQCFLGSPATASSEVSSAEWINQVSGLRQLLSEFGNLQVGMIPPCSGFLVSERLVHESDNELCWGPTGSWENALPIFHNGSGGSVCVSVDGDIGIWSRQPFQDVSSSLGEFVEMFLRRQRSGQSPPSEWWW